jgi:ribosomal protein S18 acetylase RimI-like enzyme
MDIRKLGESEADAAFGIIVAAIEDMRSRNIDQWDEIYPDRGTIADDIARGEAFGFFDSAESGTPGLAAYIALNADEPPQYDDVVWSCGERRIVIHRLCVDPRFQGKGIAKSLLAFTERFARERDCASIRLDAFIPNDAALALYEKNGYIRRGEVSFRKGRFYCYEKNLG